MLENTTTLDQQTRYNRQIAYWLLICAAVIFGMILLGGVTRLTNSGLSMVDWKPLMGIIPPLSEADWQAMFLKYQQFPEYQQVNIGMSLEEFKPIFMYEYLHRVLGRFIGLIFILPFIFLFRPDPQANHYADWRWLSGLAGLVYG
jgi:cytochrome c oxidase assembly protein subunit 15